MPQPRPAEQRQPEFTPERAGSLAALSCGRRLRRSSAPRPYSVAEFETALRLRAHGLHWAEIAERLGRDPNSLKTVISRYRRGRWARGQRESRKAETERLFLAGRSLREIAAEQGVTVRAICSRLTLMGYDREIRAQVRIGEWPAQEA